ncbi:efflux RND transporter periplasmic adaptor subunit [Rhodanobacter aciditrophus]|uniref:efflux RND transporter periplasmic adaptor subunit n=1 Tax=Rhodanobacter aciditrophus TaxID=1623218 RepID=UPI003CEA07E7
MNKPVPSFPAFPRRGVAFAALLAALALAACSSGASAPEGAATTPHNVTLTQAQQQRIRLYTVEPSTYRTETDTTGVVDYDHDRSAAVLAPFSGPVLKVLVNLGDRVKQGQPLATVASPDFAAAVDGYRKALAAARAAAQLAATDKDLYAHDAISQRENAQAQSDAVGAESDSNAARLALVALQVDPQTIRAIEQGRPVANLQGVIRAPMAGTVVQRSITPGQLLQAGSTPCFAVADLSKMWVMAQLFGNDLAKVQVGDSAEVETGAGAKTLPGSVANVSPEVDPDTRSVAARVVVDNPGGLLKKQMYVRVRVRSARPERGLLVPVDAVLRDDENLPFVYVRESDGSYARRPVTLGARTGDRYLVTKGLAAGDKVVTEGGIFVRFIQTQ